MINSKNKIQKVLYNEKIITAEWITYEELDRRIKKKLPSLDESKIKTFLIKPFFFKENEEYLNYYER
jgi:hypothetical protein